MTNEEMRRDAERLDFLTEHAEALERRGNNIWSVICKDGRSVREPSPRQAIDAAMMEEPWKDQPDVGAYEQTR